MRRMAMRKKKMSEEEQQKEQERAKSAHREVFMDCGENMDVLV